MPPRKAAATPALVNMLFAKYPGQQQVDLSVKIDVPGSWFGAGGAGTLTAGERREKYEAVAVEYEEEHVFEAAAGRKPAQGAGHQICVSFRRCRGR